MKTLEEFIENERLFECEREEFSNKDLIAYIRHAAAEILRVAEEWNGMDAYEHGYDKPTDEHTCDNCRGRQCSAEELYNFLKSYIQPVKKESDEQKV